jgi:hypothetical protein
VNAYEPVPGDIVGIHSLNEVGEVVEIGTLGAVAVRNVTEGSQWFGQVVWFNRGDLAKINLEEQ